MVERAVIASTGPSLEFAGFTPAPGRSAPAPAAPGPLKTLREQEYDHILAALQRTGGRVSGPQGAAVLLDINAKALQARGSTGLINGYWPIRKKQRAIRLITIT